MNKQKISNCIQWFEERRRGCGDSKSSIQWCHTLLFLSLSSTGKFLSLEAEHQVWAGLYLPLDRVVMETALFTSVCASTAYSPPPHFQINQHIPKQGSSIEQWWGIWALHYRPWACHFYSFNQCSLSMYYIPALHQCWRWGSRVHKVLALNTILFTLERQVVSK